MGDATNGTEDAQTLAKKYIMQAAAASALTGVNLKHGGPFGACVVRNGIFVSTAHNTVLMDNDPTCHAEMNAIRYACTALDCHDLSECELFTTCEPCPMCWGAIQWSRLRKVYTGVDRFTAARFGFDDKVFYDEVTGHAGHYSVRLGKTAPNVEPSMVRVYPAIESARFAKLLTDLQVNKTFRRRAGDELLGFRDPHFTRFREEDEAEAAPKAKRACITPQGVVAHDLPSEPNEHTKFMQMLEGAVREAVEVGDNKEREVFASLIVKADEVISVAVNMVLKRRDATATSEVLAIRKAAKRLKTYNLAGCRIYSSIEPDVMSLGAVLWARLDALYYGVTQKDVAHYGFEEGLLHYRELFGEPEIVQRVFSVETGVGHDACEQVFKEWKVVNAVVY